MNTTLIGTRLQDEAGVDFLVINVPWDWLATPVEWDTTTVVSIFESPLQQEDPDDFVIATGKSHKLADFATVVFEHVGLNLKDYLIVDRSRFRPTEIMIGRGDASKAASKLGWSPRYKMEDVALMIVDACQVELGLSSNESSIFVFSPAT